MTTPKKTSTGTDTRRLIAEKDTESANQTPLAKIPPIDLIRQESPDGKEPSEDKHLAEERRIYQKYARNLMRKLFFPRDVGINKK